MPGKTRQELYDLFITGNRPTQDDFVDLIDSAINIEEDGISVSEKGKPVEFIEKGLKRRYIDLSNSKDNPIWRINALSADGIRNGLNVSSSNINRLFISQENGLIGINNDNPLAKLHIIPESGPALRIDGISKKPSLIIDSNGNIGIGTNSQSMYRLRVEGTVNFKDQVTADSKMNIANGIVVSGDRIKAEQGLHVSGGATIGTGKLEAKEGATVSGNTLTAEAGAVVSGLSLVVKNGLIIDNGAVIETGELQAKAGISLNRSILTADGPVELGNNEVGDVNIHAPLKAKNGIIIESSLLDAQGGAVVSGAELKVNNGLTINKGLIVNEGGAQINGILSVNDGISITNSTLYADGPVVLGNGDNGDITVNGKLYANKEVVITKSALQVQNGAVISGSSLEVKNGLIVDNGLIVQTGVLNAKAGISIPDIAILTAKGVTNLGNADNGLVNILGMLRANHGREISGAELVVRNGMKVTNTLNAPDDANMGNVVMNNLHVSDATISGTLGLKSVDLDSLASAQATIENLTTEGKLNIKGSCYIVNDVYLASGILLVTFIGKDTSSPKIKIEKGTVIAGEGHFNISIDDTKLLTIVYDELSNNKHFLSDWEIYKSNNPTKAKGFNFEIVGSGLWKLKDLEIELNSLSSVFKEYRIPTNGIHILYTGVETDTPRIEIKESEAITTSRYSKYEFTIRATDLTIEFPKEEEYCTVNNLLRDWGEWKNDNRLLAEFFEIKQTADIDWQFNDILTADKFNTTQEVIKKNQLDTLSIINTGHIDNQPIAIINSAIPSSDDTAAVYASGDNLIINVGKTENTPQAIYNQWESWKKNGNDTNGFEIQETTNTSVLQVTQEENLTLVDDAHSSTYTAGFFLSYTGDNPGEAKLRLQAGDNNSFTFSIDPVNKLLVISYPNNAEERTITNLLTAWALVSNTHGFQILEDSNVESDNLSVVQEINIDTITAEIREYNPPTNGADRFLIQYIGPQDKNPQLIIQPNDSANEFEITVTDGPLMAIKYPPDRNGTVNELFEYWNGMAQTEKDNFKITVLDISDLLVSESSNDLVTNAEQNMFYKGLIKTNIVTIEGRLRFGNSSLEIDTISDNETLSENSNEIIPTQRAVKTYADTKADKISVEAALAEKADQAAMDNALASKADQTTVDSALNEKADKTAVEAALAEKANQSAMDSALASKADQATVDSALNEKADKVVVQADLAEKAEQSAMDTALANKADNSAMDIALGEKADITVMETALLTKANVKTLNNVLLQADTTDTVDDLSLIEESRGMLMVYILNQADGVPLTTGLFSIHGISTLSKIVGDNLSDTPGAELYNMYYSSTNTLTIENKSTNDIVINITYFGS